MSDPVDTTNCTWGKSFKIAKDKNCFLPQRQKWVSRSGLENIQCFLMNMKFISQVRQDF
jgi:hypothetical protein